MGRGDQRIHSQEYDVLFPKSTFGEHTQDTFIGFTGVILKELEDVAGRILENRYWLVNYHLAFHDSDGGVIGRGISGGFSLLGDGTERKERKVRNFLDTLNDYLGEVGLGFRDSEVSLNAYVLAYHGRTSGV
ncbi:MAG: hypothetical protein Q8P57_04325 [Candidatus Pacearchaeota archaeon]|nr:hypothetical protein [Candidatus Pacearchaeota archaeon]